MPCGTFVLQGIFVVLFTFYIDYVGLSSLSTR